MRKPVKSNMSFIAPEAILRPSPSIKEAIRDPQTITAVPNAATVQNAVAQSVASEVPTAVATPSSTAESPTETASAPDVPVEPVEPAAPAVPVEQLDPQSYEQLFLQHWAKMIDIVFADEPTLHSPLKYYAPELKKMDIYLTLKNEIQETDFSAKKNEVLQYIRSHFDNRINDIVTQVNVAHDNKKFVLNEDDKLIELKKQNPDLQEFINSLSLRLKN